MCFECSMLEFQEDCEFNCLLKFNGVRDFVVELLRRFCGRFGVEIE
jgi:hypothetical protein